MDTFTSHGQLGSLLVTILAASKQKYMYNTCILKVLRMLKARFRPSIQSVESSILIFGRTFVTFNLR